MKELVSRLIGGRKAVTDWMSDAVPSWLTETVRPKKVPTPWIAMLQAVIAICVPLAIGMAVRDRSLALLPALGALMSIMVDQGGPYATRFRRVAIAAVCGGAPRLLIRSLIPR